MYISYNNFIEENQQISTAQGKCCHPGIPGVQTMAGTYHCSGGIPRHLPSHPTNSNTARPTTVFQKLVSLS